MGRKLNPEYRKRLAERLSRPKCVFCGRRGLSPGQDRHARCDKIAHMRESELLTWHEKTTMAAGYYVRGGPPAWAIEPLLAYIDDMCQFNEQRLAHLQIKDFWIMTENGESRHS
jgi:hypothetical protein